MRDYYRHIVDGLLADLFDPRDAETVLTWLVSNDGRRPVVVVGAGFSRNAVNRRTGRQVSREDVPLWSDLLQRFARDLGLDPRERDPLILAELYFEEMERSAFYSTLLDLVPDGDLGPGKVHEALFDYPLKAIVTTNQLDTLLDRGPHWHRVVRDADLGLRRPGRDLIYFHGHRDDRESWILTRSQYEDILKTRPLIVTRVRQLLSQNPVLVLGYSLADPDFHHIYRQLSLDMAYHHPLGLALFPAGHAPPTPERRHWEKLGIRIASFSRRVDAVTGFTKFFDISPVGGLKTRAQVAEVAEWVREGADFPERRRRAADFLQHADRGELVRSDRRSEYSVWLGPIQGEFTEEEWRRVCAVYTADARYDRTGSWAGWPDAAGPADPRSRFMGYEVLPGDRFDVTEPLARQIDAFLAREGTARIEVARWMTFALRNELVRDERPLFIDLLSWIWRDVAAAGGDQHFEARDALRRCLALAIRDGYEGQELRIREDAASCGVDVSDVGPGEEHPREFLGLTRTAFTALLQGAFTEACATYEKAVGVARAVGNRLEEWVAVRGERDAAIAAAASASVGADLSSLFQTYEDRLGALEDSEPVKAWVERADATRRRVEQRIAETLAQDRHHRLFGGWSKGWSGYAFELWVIFRELEAMHASPVQQAGMLRPLVDLGAFEPGEELVHRLRLGIDGAEKAHEWLERVIASRDVDVEGANARNAGLLAEFTRSDVTNFELVRRLEVFAPMSLVFRAEQLSWAPRFLAECKKELGGRVHTFAGWRNLARDYPKAWCSYARLDLDPVVLDQLGEYVATLDGQIEQDEFVAGISTLPIEQWVGLHDAAAERLGELLFRLERAREATHVRRWDERFGWTLYSLARGVNRFKRDISAETASAIRTWADDTLRKEIPPGQEHLYGRLNAAACVGWTLASDPTARDAVLQRAVARMLEVPSPRFQPSVALEGPFALWAGLAGEHAPVDDGPMRVAGDFLWSLLDANWDATIGFARRNPDHAGPLADFLSTALAAAVADREGAKDRLLQVLDAAPRWLGVCAGILDPGVWGVDWTRLVDLLWQGVGGGGGERILDDRLGAFRAVQSKVFRATLGELHPDLEFLLDAALLAVMDESPIAANNAAYTIVSYARRVTDPSRTRRVVAALRSVAADPRVIVRGAAAYAAGALRAAPAEQVRHLAAELDRQFAKDDYAYILRQRRFGDLDADEQQP